MPLVGKLLAGIQDAVGAVKYDADAEFQRSLAEEVAARGRLINILEGKYPPRASLLASAETEILTARSLILDLEKEIVGLKSTIGDIEELKQIANKIRQFTSTLPKNKPTTEGVNTQDERETG